MKRALLLLLSLTAVCPASDVMISSAHRFRIETVADGLEHPWA